MNIRVWILAFSLVCISAFAEQPDSARNENLRTVLKMMYLKEQTEPLLNMFAAQAAAALGEDKTVDADQLVELFRKEFQEEALFAQFAEPYSNFSNEEIHQLKMLYESPFYIKFEREGLPAMQSNIQTISNTFQQLAEKHSVPKIIEQVSESDIIEITKENFAKEIEQSDKPVIIDIYGSSCPPCRLMEPIFEELSRQYKGKVRFAKINCESESQLAQQYQVTSLPTLLFIKSGEKTPSLKTTGFMGKKSFQTKIAEFLSKQEVAQKE